MNSPTLHHHQVQAGAGRSWSLSHVVFDLLLSRAFPATFFSLFVVGKSMDLGRKLDALTTMGQDLALLAHATQQALTIIFFTLVVVLFVIRRPVVGQRSSLVGGLVALAGTFALNIPAGAKVADDVTLLLISSALVLAGVAFSVVSLLSLGRCFGIMPEARGLVTSGPYRLVRHPLYVAETISALGLVVATASLPMVGVFALYCVLQYWRALNEERALKSVFPLYAHYCRRTARFLPGVY